MYVVFTTIHSLLYITESEVDTAHCTVHSIQYTLHSTQFTLLYMVQFSQSVYTIQYIMYRVYVLDNATCNFNM